ncbi:unnamed protein product [Arabidopsis thaliana]|uniref:RNase H type-1 domain-containing protein n=1 Tax=Arabidopsis thaliana TaxID=3702 RepID=A0A5S9X3S6_ARATH|nr:unnamed protein product [Arabidopsis thaliana]
MAYRHLSREASCVRCPDSRETVNHLLFKCCFARLVWAISPIPAYPEGEWTDSLYANLYWVLNLEVEIPKLGKIGNLVPWLLWRLWKSRNELMFKGKEYDAPEVLRRAMEDFEEWSTRRELEGKASGPQVERNLSVQWKPPPYQWVKCNTDATWQLENPRCGIGWILRNESGGVLWMGARALPRTKNVLEAELEALRWAVLTMSRFNYKRIIFESDAQALVNLLNSDDFWPTLQPALEDIQQLLHHFEEVKFEFTPRGGNKVADRIARESISFSNYDPKLFSIVPQWLRSTLI